MLNFNGYNIPGPVQTELTEFIENGTAAGPFVHAVLSNNLVDAVAFSTSAEIANIKDIVHWVVNFAPSDCWGVEAVALRWCELHPNRPKDLA